MRSKRNNIVRVFAEIILASVAGMVVVLLPIIFGAEPPPHDQTVFLPIVREAMVAWKFVPHGDPLFLGLLIVAGFPLGIIGRGPVKIVGPAIVLGLPAWSLIDLIAGGGGHNLLPIECFGYAFLSVFGFTGAWLGRAVMRWWMKKNQANEA